MTTLLFVMVLSVERWRAQPPPLDISTSPALQPLSPANVTKVVDHLALAACSMEQLHCLSAHPQGTVAHASRDADN